MMMRTVSRMMCGATVFVAVTAIPAQAQQSPDEATATVANVAMAEPASGADLLGGMDNELSSMPASQPANGFAARQKAIDRRSAQNEYEYALAQHNCYSKFFVTHCLNRAHDKMRGVQAGIRRDQLALGEEERADHARQRDTQAALQRAQDEAEAPQRAANEARNARDYAEKQRQHVLDEAQDAAETPQRAAAGARNAQADDERLHQPVLSAAQRGEMEHRAATQAALAQPGFQQKLEAARREGAQKARQRAQNVAKYQQKQANAAQHKAAVEHRQQQAAEKARQQQAKP